MKQKFAAILVLVCIQVCMGFSYHETVTHDMPGLTFEPRSWTLAFSLGAAHSDFDDINHELRERELASIDAWGFRFGGLSLHRHLGSLVFGGNVLVDGRGVPTVALTAVCWRVAAGYSVVTLPWLVVTPMLGVGYNHHTLTVQHSGYPGNFNRFMEGPGPTTALAFSGLTLTPEVVVDVPFSLAGSNSGIMLKAGYMLTTESTAWKLGDGNPLPDGPSLGMGRTFITLGIVLLRLVDEGK